MRACIDAEETVRRMNAKTENLKKYDIYGKEADRIRKELQKTTEVKKSKNCLQGLMKC